MNETRLFELDRQAVESVEVHPKARFTYEKLAAMTGRPFVFLSGPRGVGKTVLFRRLRSKRKNSIYLSADTFEPGDRLADLVSSIHRRHRIDTFFIDEIHYFPGYAADLKELFDFLPVKIFCTSSVSLSIEQASVDLSRRVAPLRIGQCSFREYISLALGIDLPPLEIGEVLSGRVSSTYLATATHFDAYLRGAGYPFTFEPGAGLQQFGQIRDKIRLSDIPAFDANFSLHDLDLIGKTLTYLGRSHIEGSSYSSISRNVGITKYMAERHIDVLERSFLVRRAFPSGTNVLREPKIFLELPYRLLYQDIEMCLGLLREDFFALCMELHHTPFTYAKSVRGAKTPDFLIELEGKPIILEVGGRGKGRSQFKGLSYDQKTVLTHSDARLDVTPSRVPLFLLGFPA